MIVIILIYLYYSNSIIIKKLIFLFLDLTEEDFSKRKNNSLPITLKLLKFQKLLNDFDLKMLNKYSNYLDNINNNQLEKKKITFVNKKENNKISNERKENKHTHLSNKNLNSISSISPKTKRGKNNNNSSCYYLAKTDSYLTKEKLNTNSTKSRGEILENLSKQNILSKNKSLKNIILIQKYKNNNNLKENINFNLKENYQEAILNKSNKTIIPIIKLYLIIIISFLFVIIIYTAFKIINNYYLNNQCLIFYIDFTIITERYYKIYYYFNVFKTIIILNSNDLRWKNMMNIMENMNKEFEQIDNDYHEVLSHSKNYYNKVKKLIELLNYNKNDTNILIKENICRNNVICEKYLESPECIFNLGIDNVYNSITNYFRNIFSDYKNLKNYNNLTELISSITSTERYDMMYIRESFRYVF